MVCSSKASSGARCVQRNGIPNPRRVSRVDPRVHFFPAFSSRAAGRFLFQAAGRWPSWSRLISAERARMPSRTRQPHRVHPTARAKRCQARSDSTCSSRARDAAAQGRQLVAVRPVRRGWRAGPHPRSLGRCTGVRSVWETATVIPVARNVHLGSGRRGWLARTAANLPTRRRRAKAQADVADGESVPPTA